MLELLSRLYTNVTIGSRGKLAEDYQRFQDYLKSELDDDLNGFREHIPESYNVCLKHVVYAFCALPESGSNYDRKTFIYGVLFDAVEHALRNSRVAFYKQSEALVGIEEITLGARDLFDIILESPLPDGGRSLVCRSRKSAYNSSGQTDDKPLDFKAALIYVIAGQKVGNCNIQAQVPGLRQQALINACS